LKLRILLPTLFLSAIFSAMAQQGRGTISGTVTDPSGAAVKSVRIEIRNTETNTIVATQSNGEGYYLSPPLIVGSYEITAQTSGFKKEVRTGITLQVDQHAEINLQLQVGAATESVQVMAEASLVNTENASVGQVIENKRVEDLPLNGRNAFALVQLSPNVHSNAGPNQSGFADRGTSLSDWSINGGPNAANLLLVDGTVAQNSYYPDLNANLAVDAVQEFKVQSGSMSAEYGFTLGGVINVASKAGTNQYHGTAYEFLRNNDLDARNTFASIRPEYRYNQYGASFGGPVIIPKLYNGRNRTFFFANWEQYNYVTYGDTITSTPPVAQRTGNFSQLFTATGQLIPIYDPATTQVNPNGSGYVRSPFPGNIIPPSRLDPVAQAMNQFYPAPNLTPSNAFTQANNYESINPGEQDMKQYTLRGDQHISDSDTMFARFTYYDAYTNNCPCTWPSFAVNGRYDHFGTRNVALDETHTFSPRLINEIRIGVARQSFPFQSASYNQGWPQKLGLPASVPNTVFPTITNGYTALGNATVGYRGALTWDVTDTLTLVLGSHSLKFGAEYRLLFGNNYQTSAPSGSFTFTSGLTGNPQNQSGTGSSYAAFLLGAVSSASGVLNTGESEKGFTMSGFIQDDWRLSRNLNVNLGLRYDFQQPPYERNCGTSNFNPAATDPVGNLMGAMQYACKDYGSTFLKPDYTDFAPRIGIAWDPHGNGKTAVRAGYALFYAGTFNITYFGNTAGFASTTTSYSPPGGNSNLPAFNLYQGFPTPLTEPLGSSLGPSYLLGQAVNYDQPDQKTPLSQQWNVSLQKQIFGGWVIDASYTGNHGTHLVAGSYNLDQIASQYLSLGNALQNPVPNPYAGIVPGALGAATITKLQSLLPFPYYTSVTVRNPHLGNSIYHSGLLTVQKRLQNGLTVLVAYTKSKLISDSVAAPINFGSVVQVTNNGYQNGAYDRRLERSVDPTDVPQRLTISALYELPFGAGKQFDSHNGFVNAIVGGWQAQTIITLQKGLPVLISGASNNLATRPNSTGQSAQLANPTQYEWFNTAVFVNPPNYTYGNVGRALPDVRNPGFFNCDLSLIKNNRIKERLNVQLRVEFFNFDNHTNLGLVNSTFVPGSNGLNSSSTFGTITSAMAPRTIQVGMKLIF
jgi:Carboxypeptidase regulatory-like domain/TonB-dependent Receptor Plug Domain